MRVIFLLPLLMLTACATLSGGRDYRFTCPFDTVWDATLDTIKGYPVTSKNKSTGTIETAWMEVEGKTRTHEGLGNLERIRLTVTVKQDPDASLVNVLETRQRWHVGSGVKQLGTRWRPVEPSEEAMQEITEKLRARLKEKGCTATP